MKGGLSCRMAFDLRLDWAGECRPEGREVVEAALAHVVANKTEAAYSRSDLLERRRPLMEAWAEQCRSPTAIILPLERQQVSA